MRKANKQSNEMDTTSEQIDFEMDNAKMKEKKAIKTDKDRKAILKSIEQDQKSGMSFKAACENNEVSTASVYLWIKKYKKPLGKEIESALARMENPKDVPQNKMENKMEFVNVRSESPFLMVGIPIALARQLKAYL
jgi:hypothetical protein